ncbi:MAG: preprotein translocase subunit YajC, partial [Elusimicrobia bacterium]|nr:preprotein translocase subunit YajC [Elusimicrobiota bacterium]
MKILLTALFLSIPSLAFADGGGALGGLGGLMPLILIFAVFYILIIRPQQKKASDHTKMV